VQVGDLVQVLYGAWETTTSGRIERSTDDTLTGIVVERHKAPEWSVDEGPLYIVLIPSRGYSVTRGADELELVSASR